MELWIGVVQRRSIAVVRTARVAVSGPSTQILDVNYLFDRCLIATFGGRFKSASMSGRTAGSR